jgi:hypothetical protein
VVELREKAALTVFVVPSLYVAIAVYCEVVSALTDDAPWIARPSSAQPGAKILTLIDAACVTVPIE